MSLAGGKEAAEVMGACVPGPGVEQGRQGGRERRTISSGQGFVICIQGGAAR